MPRLELFGTSRCPHTQELREWLEWQGRDFVEHDVELDASARHRMLQLSSGQRSVPILVEDNVVLQIGWQGRTCMIEADPT